MPSEFVFEPRRPRYGPFLVSGCWCTLRRFWGNNKQALLLTVLAIAPPHRSGLYSTLAILEPRWWPSQIQLLSQKLTGGGPGRGCQVGRCPPKSAQFWAKNSHFSPKTAPKPGQNAQTKGYGEYTARAASLHRVKELSSALQFHDMSEKQPKKAPKSPKNLRNAHHHPETKHKAYLGLGGSNPNSEGA